MPDGLRSLAGNYARFLFDRVRGRSGLRADLDVSRTGEFEIVFRRDLRRLRVNGFTTTSQRIGF